MASLIPGFEYDIFISYRQKDNKHDGWVTEFEDNLKGELESTFKEEISVYFDINPHDGLLETHDIDESLKDKLKCLIFIPIISRTYCDPKSFAWEHEFKAFLDLASKDQFGLRIKLPGGNVAGRVLPVRIHDLEPEDIKLFEKETGTVLRALDFVFRTATGVNRPLKANEDHPGDNLNRTFYTDQVNKVALAIKEILVGMKKELSPTLKESVEPNEHISEIRKESKDVVNVKPGYSAQRKVLPGVIITVAMVIVVVLFLFPELFQTGKNKIAKDPDGKISIAVTLFVNNSNDTTLKWLENGIPELFRNDLAVSNELSVQNSQTMYELYESMSQTRNASVMTTYSRDAAIKLKAGAYLTGSFQKSGSNILILAKLIDTKTDEVLWTGDKEGTPDKPKQLTDSLSEDLRKYLEIRILKQKTDREYPEVNTSSPEALRKYIEGMQFMIAGNLKPALQCFEESYKLDTTFILAAVYASFASSYSYNFISAQKWTRINYRERNKLPYDYKIWMELCEAANITRNCDSVLICNDLLSYSGIKSRLFWYDLAYNYQALELYEKAVKAYDKVNITSSDWGGDWKFLNYYLDFGYACHKAGLYEKEAKILETGLKLFPDDGPLIFGLARWALSTGDTTKAREYINKRITIAKKAKWPTIQIEKMLANLYSQSDMLDKAEEYYRNIFLSDQRDIGNIYLLANFLIINDRKVAEGISLIEPLQINYSDNYFLFKLKGIGYFKLGKYKEAFEILKKYEGYQEGAVWDPQAFNYLKKTREALSRQN